MGVIGGLLFFQLIIEEEKVDAKGDAAADHADVGHVEDGKMHELEVEHVGDKTEEGPVDEISHSARQHHGEGDHAEGMGHHPFDQRGGDGRRHHGGDDGEEPGMVFEDGEGRAGVLHVGELHQPGEKGHRGAQGDIGADQDLHKLVCRHQKDDENGVQHSWVTPWDGDPAVFLFR